MQTLEGRIVHSATDLNAYTECLHLVALEREVVAHGLERPIRDAPTAKLLARKGEEHERRYLERLRERYGNALVAFEDRPVATLAGYEAAERESIAAMERGAPVIYQATFFDGTFLGRADFLRRVDRPSERWAWSYEVIDTKLALSPKPYFIVQLCNYSEHLERIAGAAAENAAIVLGTGEERRFRLADFAAYYRRLKVSYLASFARAEDAYPFECPHCELCVWRDRCAAKRNADDHLSLVAGMRRDQLRKLEDAGITSMRALAEAADRLRPPRMVVETFDNLRAQAAEQHRYRARLDAEGSGTHSYSFRPESAFKTGFARLPEPAAGDIFFDMEGDPLYRPDRALEYLFGVYLPAEDAYEPFWGTSPADERAAFEAFVDFVVARQERYPNLHVYHYAPYETTALKRLMGRFGSRESVVDGWLRAGTFVDLYGIVRQSVWISQPSYSIKKVEALYGFERHTLTLGGDDSIVMFESWLESQDPAVLEDIRAYNEDDCRSTYALREWLVRLRAERNVTLETAVPWRQLAEYVEPEADVERSALEVRLLEGIPEPESLAGLRASPDTVRARWLLGNLLQYHRREQKPEWWEFFYRIAHTEGLIDEDRKSIGGLRLCEDVPPYKFASGDRNLTYTYTFPRQEHEFHVGSVPFDPATGKQAGEIVSMDETADRLRIKLSKAVDAAALHALIPSGPLNDRNKRKAIEAIAKAYDDESLARDYPATHALLLAETPRLSDRAVGATLQPQHVTKEAVSTGVQALDQSYLVVQGPPGSGKSTTGAHVIVDLLAAGKRVALAAQSHKALHNLLRMIEETACERKFVFAGCHKSSDTSAGSPYEAFAVAPMVADATSADGYAGCTLVSATTFAWADERQRGAFDVVAIDEAGQISLADALVTSLVARNVVLLGDPQQLPQVLQGSHPIGTDRSILEHLLGDEQTIPAERGVFLDTSYRMHPQIDAFVSDAFYEGRLHADPLNANNRVVPGTGGLRGGGLRYLAVDHDGNERRSFEEADRIVAEIAVLLDRGTVTVRDKTSRLLTADDVLVVAPYNLQRLAITERLLCAGLGAVRVGTVDKFQGQQAPVVFYSMATSAAELAPRGLEFLLSPNRLNVAVSRAQVLTALTCNPQLLASRAATIDHMRLLSLLCSYVEAVQGLGDSVVRRLSAPRHSEVPGLNFPGARF